MYTIWTKKAGGRYEQPKRAATDELKKVWYIDRQTDINTDAHTYTQWNTTQL